MDGHSPMDFRALFEGAPCLYLALDPNFRIVAASDAYLRATMRHREDILGREMFDAFPADPSDPSADAHEGLIRASLERVRAERIADTTAVRLHVPSRTGEDEVEVRHWRIINSPVLDQDELDYIIHWVEDVSEYVRLQQATAGTGDLTTALRERAIKAQPGIHRRPMQSRQTNRELRAASEAKDEFLSRMSHELRTLLAAILGFGELLALRDLGEKENGWVKLIHSAGRHLLALVDEMMDLSRIESGNVTISPETILIEPLIREAFQLMQPLAAGLNIQLHDPVVEASASPYVLADPQRLTQVIINLLSNAIKYNRPNGEVAITVAAAADGWIRVAVRDTGPGIDEELQPRLFIPFDRLTAAATDIEGTGLGLALSRNLVESMHGRIGVDSTVGVGSTFWIELPASAPKAAEEPQPDEPLLATRRYSGERRVLYVEDVVETARLMEEVLERRPSITLLPAMLGQLGLDLAREHRPQLVILDLHLPDMTGENALALLLADPATRDTPVVVLTADANCRQADRLRKLGARAYLTKPIAIRELLAVVDEFLDTAETPGAQR